MKSLVKESRNLDFSELLTLNGGYGSTSKSSSSSGGGYGGSSAGAASKYGKYATLEEYKASVEFAKLNEERITFFGDGTGYSSLTGYFGSSTGYSTTSGSGSSRGASGSSGGDTSNSSASEEAKKQNVIMSISNPHTAEEYMNLYMASSNTLYGNVLRHIIGEDKLATENIIQTVNEDMKNGKVVYEKKEGGFMCDNYVQNLLERCGIDYKSYFSGEAKDKTVTQHIANLDPGKNYSSAIVEKGCTYVCFMTSSQKGYEDHCAIMVSTKNGGYYMVDNSSGNKAQHSSGGLGLTYGNSLSDLEKQFGYSKFYYQKVKK